MLTSIIGTVVWLAFVVLLARGGQGEGRQRATARSQRAREWTELAVVIVGLLMVPYLSASVLWIRGWLAAYLLFLLFAPLVLEWLVRRRSLAAIGVRLPVDRRTLRVVAILVLLLFVVRLGQPLLAGERLTYTWHGVVANVLVFPYLEEKMFRGVIRVRLEATLGRPSSWLVCGLLFGLFHLYANYLVPGRAVTAEVWAALAYLIAFGFLLGVIATRTRSIFPSFLIHLANNL
jgi:membrane protease YdiL (CAAX protease family)